MKTLRIILIAIGALVAVVLIAAALLPKEAHVERSILVEAEPGQVYPYVSTFEKRNEWYPWYRRDPSMSLRVEGTDGEVGAVSIWEGDPNTVGSGQQTLTRLVENQRVETDLEFTAPMESKASSFVALEEQGDQTKVTWGLDTRLSYPMNLMLVFMDMDAAVGKDYEEGLEKLKEVVEKNVKAYNGYTIQKMDMPERHFVVMRAQIPFDKVPSFYEQYLPKISSLVQNAGLQMEGMPCGLFYDWNEETGITDMAAGIPVSTLPAKLPKMYGQVTLPAGPYLVIDYYGPYEKSGAAHEALGQYLDDHGLQSGPPAYEEYLTDPGQESDQNKWLTRIYYPVLG